MSTQITQEVRKGDRVEVEGHVLGGTRSAPGGPGTVREVYGPGHYSGRAVALVELDGGGRGRLVDLALVRVTVPAAGVGS